MLLPAQQNIQGLPLTDIGLADSLPVFDSSASSNQRITVERLLALISPLGCGRLTTESGVPISTTDRTSQGTLYFTPYKGNAVKLHDGTRWKLFTFSEISKALSGLTTNQNYDVFLYDNSGTLDLEFVAWTNNTTRATALTTQDGIYVKSGDTTRLYLGTFRTTSATTTEDSQARRFVWNHYNRVMRSLLVLESANSWTYTTASYRQMNNNSANQVELVTGVAEQMIRVEASALAGGAALVYASIGEDSATTPEANATPVQIGNYMGTGIAVLMKVPTIGYHYYAALEYGAASGAFYGDAGISDRVKNGLRGWVWG